MIRSFKNALTEAVFNGGVPKGFPSNIVKIARRKLEAVNAAETVPTCAARPGNRLHALGGDRQDEYAIRINDQYRVCFVWKIDVPHEVEIVDYSRGF